MPQGEEIAASGFEMEGADAQVSKNPPDMGDAAAQSSANNANDPTGVRLLASQAETSAGQIAANGAMRIAYWCAVGEPIDPKVLNAWAEGGQIMEMPRQSAEILSRMCYSLGVLVEVTGREA